MRVAHIADVHIFPRNYNRLKYAWTEFVAQITAKQVDVICIAGDIFEFKTHLRGTDIEMFNEMMTSVPRGVRVVMIPGNHDYNQENGTDLISHLVEPFDHIYYSKYSRTLTLDGVDFHCISPYDGGKIHPKRMGGIALYHDMVRGAKLQNGTRVSSGEYEFDDFAKTYDITMLGDIHIYQKPTANVAYCGSFVQKTRGEGIVHGWILWNTESGKGKFQRLTSYGNYIRIRVVNGVYHAPDAVAPESVELEYINTDEDVVLQCKTTLQNKYGVDVQCVDFNTYETEATEQVDNHNVEQLIRVICEKNEYPVDDILQLYTADSRDFPCRTRWELLSLRFNNVYAYGDGNTIDFTRINSIASLAGANAIGKSSIANILLYILYQAKHQNGRLLLNNQNTRDGVIEATIRAGNDTYVITRTIMRRGARNPIEIRRNGEVFKSGDVPDAYRFLEKLIGTETDFREINLSAQDINKPFICKSNTEIKATIARILGVEGLGKIIKRVKSDINRLSNKNLATLKQQYETEISAMRDEIAGFDSDKTRLECEHVTLNEKRADAEKQIRALTGELRVCERVNEPTKQSDVSRDDVTAVMGSDVTLEMIRGEIKQIRYVADQYSLQLSGWGDEPVSMDISEYLDQLKSVKPYDEQYVVDEVREAVECDKPSAVDRPDSLDLVQIPADFDAKRARLDVHHVTGDVDEIERAEKRDTPSGVDIPSLQDKLSCARVELAKYKAYPVQSYDTRPAVEDYNEMVQKIRELERNVVAYDETRYHELLAEYENCKEKYKCLTFNGTCSACQDNQRRVGKISGSDIIKSQLDDMKSAHVREQTRVGQLRRTERAKTLLGGQLHKFYKKRCRTIESKIDEALVHERAYENHCKWQIIQKNARIHSQLSAYEHNMSVRAWLHYQEQLCGWRAWQEYKNTRIYGENRRIKTHVERGLGAIYNNLLKYKTCLQWCAYQEYVDTMRSNAELRERITEMEHAQVRIDDDINAVVAQQIELSKNTATLSARLDTTTEKLQQLMANYAEQTLLSQYMSVISEVISAKITQTIPKIEHMWNKQLSHIPDIGVRLKYTRGSEGFSDGEINISMVEDGREIACSSASGFQRFILDFMFRIVALEFAEIPLGKFVMIDEGVSCADADNKSNIRTFLGQAKIPFTFLLLISHDIEFANVGTYNLVIQSVNGYSSIRCDTMTGIPIVTRTDQTEHAERSAEQRRRRRPDQEYIDRARECEENTIAEQFDGLRCRVCDRVLKSRTTANKHLNSNKHLKTLGKQLLRQDDEI